MHFYRAHHSSERVLILKRVLQRDRVEHSREHSHVISGRAVQALCRKRQSAKNVTTADYYGDFYGEIMNVIDLLGYSSDGGGIDPVALVSHQRLARELEQYSLVDWFPRHSL